MRPKDEPKLKCCADMVNAQESGTDNESYGSLVYYLSGSYHLGSSDLPDISFCPWCGRSIASFTGVDTR
jgi:hypothetical protein